MISGILNLLIPLLFIVSILLLVISVGMYFLGSEKTSKKKAIKIGILPLIYVIVMIIIFSKEL